MFPQKSWVDLNRRTLPERKPNLILRTDTEIPSVDGISFRSGTVSLSIDKTVTCTAPIRGNPGVSCCQIRYADRWQTVLVPIASARMDDDRFHSSGQILSAGTLV
jgi:hypothetical protein